MLPRIGQCLLALTLIVAIGGHWAALQSVAWLGMVVSYSKDASLSVAFEKTFDGHHPCKLCKMVREGQNTEHKADLLKVETKFDFWVTHRSPLLFPPPPFAVLSSGPDSALLRAESPPPPPPRFA